MRSSARRDSAPARSLWALATASAALVPLNAAAQFDGVPYASVGYERDSNVYRVADDAESLANSGTTQRSDDIVRYAAGLNATYLLGPQKFFLDAEGRSLKYSRFKQIDHDAHSLAAGLDWRIASLMSGKIKLQDERRLQDFGDLRSNLPGGNRRGLVDTRSAAADAALNVTPQWQLLGGVAGEQVRNTRQSTQEQDRDETSFTAGFAYLGRPISSVGLEVELTEGDYPRRDPQLGNTEEFDQVDYRLTALWKPSGISTVEAKLGGSRRDNRGIEVKDFSGATGEIKYIRTVSGKTKLNFEVFRRVASVEQQDANFVVNLGGAVRADWNATPKVDVVLSALYSNEDYDGSPNLDDAQGKPREDRVTGADLRVRYTPFRWLVLSPSLAYETRKSNRDDSAIDNVEYDDTRVGFELRLQIPS